MPPEHLRIFVLHGSHFLTDYNFNGDGLVAWGFINELARRGHTVHVATDRLDVKQTIPSNLTLVEFPRVRRNPVLHYFSYMLRVRRYYERLEAGGGVDLAHQMNPVVRGLSLALLGKRAPVVLGTFVGDWVRLRGAPNYRKPTLRKRFDVFAKAVIDGLQQHFATALVLATPHALARIPFAARAADRIAFVHHGVDVDLYSPDAATNDPEPARNRLLFVGQIHVQKGILELVEALARVRRAVPDVSLVVVGDGYLEPAVRAKLVELGCLDCVTFTGRVSRAEVAGWMRASSVLCAPSFGEPYGQNVLEAMATGKPVVIATEGGHPHIGDHDGALFVSPGSVDQLEAAILRILSDPARAAAMGAHNRHIAVERHAWPVVTDRLEEVYRRALASQDSYVAQ